VNAQTFGRGAWIKGQYEGHAAWIHADFIVYRAANSGNPWVARTKDGKHIGPWCRSAATAQAICQAYAEGLSAAV
jgi:hypothetical protein